MSYQSELNECCKGMSDFAKEQLLVFARALVKRLPGPEVSSVGATADTRLTLVEKPAKVQLLPRHVNRRLNEGLILMVRESVDG